MEKIIYKAGVYCRISKEDGDKIESDSIANQKSLINDFLKNQSDIRVFDIFEDDGYTGVNFQRPDFERMMKEVKNGNVNCIVVKDLSRFGRNYIETGKYLEKIFPFIGVRVIAINDNYDSAKIETQTDKMITPFKNLMNDSYSRDISIKTRSQLESKRRAGQFISPFSSYGYLKSAEDRHKLVIDEYAAGVIRDIFKMKIEGMGEALIAEVLNERGILSPAEYKKSLGLKYKTSFQVNVEARWSYTSIRRILKDELYIGKLIQGKTTTPNHKVRKVEKKQADKIVIIENNHEPIILKEEFYLVNRLLQSEARTAPGEKTTYPFSGVLVCGDCGQRIIRKAQTQAGKQYVHYLCSTYKRGEGCTRHSFKHEWLEETVLAAVKHFIADILTVRDMLRMIDDMPLKSCELQKRTLQLEKKKQESEKYKDFVVSLSEKFHEGVFNQDEFMRLKLSYNEKSESADQAIAVLEEEIEQIKNGNINNVWIDAFLEYKDVTELTRPLVVSLIHEIKIYENKQMEIIFRHQDEYLRVAKFINDNLIGEVI